MAFECKVIADSLAPNGKRLFSVAVKYPLIVHGEFLRHRSLAFGVQSNRAVPTKKVIDQVRSDPFIPIHWGAAQKGMQADNQVSEQAQSMCYAEWMCACDEAVSSARRMLELGLHKQVINRILSPYQWVTQITTGTEWDNFFCLRLGDTVEPHMKRIAEMIYAAYKESTPKPLKIDEWHCPYIWEDEEHLPWPVKLKLSAARCARVSYLTHEGKRDQEEDFRLYRDLTESNPKHMSPTEHQGKPATTSTYSSGNFYGYVQARQIIPGNTCWDYETWKATYGRS